MIFYFCLSAAAAIRKASTTASLQNHSPQVNRTTITPKRVENRLNISALIDEEDGTNKKNRNRSELMYEDEDDVPNEKLDKIILKERERLEREKNEKKNSEKKKNVHSSAAPALEANKNKLKDSVDGADSSPSSSKMSKTDSSSSKADVASTSRTKRQSSPIRAPPVKKLKETKERTYKPFNKLLEGVVLVISGIQVCIDEHLTDEPTQLTFSFLYRTQREPIFDDKHWKWVPNINQTGRDRAPI